MSKEKYTPEMELKMFESFLVDRNDEIDNASYAFLALMAGKDLDEDEKEFPWDMELIGEVNETAQSVLEKKGYGVCWPYYSGEHETPCYKAGDCMLAANGNCLFINNILK